MPAAASNQRCTDFLGVMPPMTRQARLTLQAQAAPYRWPIKRLREENTPNDRASKDDPAPSIDNLPSYLHISSLVRPSWWRSDISLLPRQAAAAILPRPSSLRLLVIGSVLNVISSSHWELCCSSRKCLLLRKMLPSSHIIHALPEKKNPESLFFFPQEEEIISMHKPESTEFSGQELHGFKTALTRAGRQSNPVLHHRNSVS